jgi:hypothetical protein
MTLAVEHFGYFHCLAIVNNAIIHVSVKVPLLYPDLCSFGYSPRSGVAGSYS